MPRNPSDIAAEYRARGWAVVPVDRGTKSPYHEQWPELAAERAFSAADFEGRNVGVVLGSVSGGLVDVDLDSQAAIALAPHFLPPTLTFGRASKPASHWLYRAPGARAAKLWFKCEGERELVELRATNASNDACGHQTVFPGSTHTSGEAIAFDNDATPAEVDAGDLLWRLCRLAVASSILGGYFEGNHRNAQTLGYAGGLLKSGWTADEVRELFEAVRFESGYDRPKDADAVERVISAFENGVEVVGFGSLVNDGVIDADTVAHVERHAKTPEQRKREAQLASTRAGAGLRDRLIAEARETDGIVAAAEIIAKGASHATELERSTDHTGRTDLHGGEHTLGLEARGTVADLTAEPTPLTYLWGCLAPGKVSALAGFANGAKSPFALSLALHAVLGRDFCGMSIRQCRAAYLDFESGKLSTIRLRRLARGLGLQDPPDGLTLLHMHDYLGEEFLRDLEAYAVAKELGLVVIDTYGAALPGDIDHNSAQFAHWLKQLGRMSNALDVVILVLLHEKKREQGKRRADLEMISGHNSAPGALQGVISLYRPDEDDKTLIGVHCSRAPEEAFESFFVRWEDVPDPAAVEIVGDTPGARLQREKLSKWGLRVEVTDEPTELGAGPKLRERLEQLQSEVIDVVTLLGPTGAPVPVPDIVGELRKTSRTVKPAIDQLVMSGRLRADYIVGVTTKRRQHVWIPGLADSLAGEKQRKADNGKR